MNSPPLSRGDVEPTSSKGGLSGAWRCVALACYSAGRVKRCPLFLVALFALLVAPAALSEARTTAPDVYVTTFITLSKSKVSVSPDTAPQGSYLRLVVTNIESTSQRFSFDYVPLASGKHTGFKVVFKPHQRRIFLLELDNEGRLAYFSGSSFDSAGGSQRGEFVVGPQCAECDG